MRIKDTSSGCQGLWIHEGTVPPSWLNRSRTAWWRRDKYIFTVTSVSPGQRAACGPQSSVCYLLHRTISRNESDEVRWNLQNNRITSHLDGFFFIVYVSRRHKNKNKMKSGEIKVSTRGFSRKTTKEREFIISSSGTLVYVLFISKGRKREHEHFSIKYLAWVLPLGNETMSHLQCRSSTAQDWEVSTHSVNCAFLTVDNSFPTIINIFEYLLLRHSGMEFHLAVTHYEERH